MLIPSTTLITSPGAGVDGWVNDIENAWTYVSASSFSTLGDRTVIFSKGTRIKVTDGSVKYFVVVASSFGAGITTVTITGGSDYSLSGGALNNNYYSYAANPQGYPKAFTYTPVWDSTGSSPSLGNGSISGRFSTVGSLVYFNVEVTMGSTTTYGAATWRVSLPIASEQHGATIDWMPIGVHVRDASATSRFVGTGQMSLNTAVLLNNMAAPLAGYASTVPITWAVSDSFVVSGYYEME